MGVARGPGALGLRTAVEDFLLRVDVLPWDSEAAQHYAQLRAERVPSREQFENRRLEQRVESSVDLLPKLCGSFGFPMRALSSTARRTRSMPKPQRHACSSRLALEYSYGSHLGFVEIATHGQDT